MKCLRMVALAAVLVFSAAPALQAQTDMVRKVDSFDFLVDYSGSMMMTNANLKENKMELAKQILTAVNSAIPALGYMSSMHTLAPVGNPSAYASWDSAALAGSIGALSSSQSIYGRLTPIGDGFMALNADYNAMARPTAAILVSDGANNTGSDPVAQAQALYTANPGLCIHVVSLADDAAGQAALDSIAALNDCTVMVNGADLVASQDNVNQFVSDVFYTSGYEVGFVLRGVNFAFDSYALDAQAHAILDEVAAVLLADPAKATLEGWTDYVGTDAYNATLSLRRAQAVRDYLIQKGVPAADLTAVGMGKSYKYDNTTEEGRYLNRRTELLYN